MKTQLILVTIFRGNDGEKSDTGGERENKPNAIQGEHHGGIEFRDVPLSATAQTRFVNLVILTVPKQFSSPVAPSNPPHPFAPEYVTRMGRASASESVGNSYDVG